LPADTQAVAVFLSEEANLDTELPRLDARSRRAVERLIRARAVSGKAKELAFDIVDSGEESAGRVYVVGVGPVAKVDAEKLRRAAGQLARALRKHRIASVAVVVPSLEAITPADAADAIATGMLLSRFEFTQYKGSANQAKESGRTEKTPLRATVVPAAEDADAVRSAVDRASVIADGQNIARTVASRPGNDINPPTLAAFAQQLAREAGLGIRLLDEKQMTRLGMGGILAVGSGSANPPRMIVLEHKGPKGRAARGKGQATRRISGAPVPAASSPLLIVGKAITFDTGGISIKPAEKMGEMVYDKCGGMAVLGLM
jgi:leucyl aminopeptidase